MIFNKAIQDGVNSDYIIYLVASLENTSGREMKWNAEIILINIHMLDIIVTEKLWFSRIHHPTPPALRNIRPFFATC